MPNRSSSLDAISSLVTEVDIGVIGPFLFTLPLLSLIGVE